MDIGPQDRLGDILIREEIITGEQLDQAVQCQVLFGGRLGTNLLELGFVTKDQLRDVLERKYGLPSVSRDRLEDIEPRVIRMIPRELAVEHALLPVRHRENTLEVAMIDPWKEASLAAVRERAAHHVQPLVALENDLAWALEKYYAVKRTVRFANLDRWIEQNQLIVRKPKKKKKAAEPMLPDPQDLTATEGAPRDLDDFWDRVGRTKHPEYHLPKVLADLEAARSRDEIAAIILDFASLVFLRTILFVVNQDLVMGWDGKGQGIDSRIALAIMLPLSRRSVFKTVVETGSYFLGPAPDTPINRRFLGALGSDQPKTVLLLPLMVGSHVAAILYGDMGHEQKITGKLAPIQHALNAAGQALHRLILKSKSENPQAPA